MIALYKIDQFISNTLKEQEFVDFCRDTIDKELKHFIQVDAKYMQKETNYIYIANFGTWNDKENKRETYKSFIDFVIDFGEPTTTEGVTRHLEKESLEKVANFAIESISRNLRELSPKLKLLSVTTNIAETAAATTIKCVVPLTFGITRNLGECK